MTSTIYTNETRAHTGKRLLTLSLSSGILQTAMAAAVAKVGFSLSSSLYSSSSSSIRVSSSSSKPLPLPPPSPRTNNLSFTRVAIANTFFHSSSTNRRSTVTLASSSSSLVDEQQLSSSEPFTEAENLLIEALIGIQGRGRSASPQQIKNVENAIQVLEASNEGVSDPTSSSLIEGCWRLIFTTRPGTASPIQRTFVGVDYFNVFQQVFLRTEDPRVSNIVQFSDAIGELKVEAAASINDGTRILFRFDRAAFSLKFLPFKVPYPVPFRLLGDEAKGWLDTTYLSHSGNIRISRGNKGTTFVLQKKTEPRQRLLSAISTGAGVTEAIDDLVSPNQLVGEGEPELPAGEWQLLWSSQMETDSWIENAANGLMGKQIVKENGQLNIVVDILLGFRFSMDGTFVKSGSKTYSVNMDDAAILAGPFGVPIEMKNSFKLELLYADGKIRISRGYKQILFVHLRVDDGSKRK